MSGKLQLRLQPGNQALSRLVSQRTSHQPIIEMLGVPASKLVADVFQRLEAKYFRCTSSGTTIVEGPLRLVVNSVTYSLADAALCATPLSTLTSADRPIELVYEWSIPTPASTAVAPIVNIVPVVTRKPVSVRPLLPRQAISSQPAATALLPTISTPTAPAPIEISVASQGPDAPTWIQHALAAMRDNSQSNFPPSAGYVAPISSQSTTITSFNALPFLLPKPTAAQLTPDLTSFTPTLKESVVASQVIKPIQLSPAAPPSLVTPGLTVSPTPLTSISPSNAVHTLNVRKHSGTVVAPSIRRSTSSLAGPLLTPTDHKAATQMPTPSSPAVPPSPPQLSPAIQTPTSTVTAVLKVAPKEAATQPAVQSPPVVESSAPVNVVASEHAVPVKKSIRPAAIGILARLTQPRARPAVPIATPVPTAPSSGRKSKSATRKPASGTVEPPMESTERESSPEKLSAAAFVESAFRMSDVDSAFKPFQPTPLPTFRPVKSALTSSKKDSKSDSGRKRKQGDASPEDGKPRRRRTSSGKPSKVSASQTVQQALPLSSAEVAHIAAMLNAPYDSNSRSILPNGNSMSMSGHPNFMSSGGLPWTHSENPLLHHTSSLFGGAPLPQATIMALSSPPRQLHSSSPYLSTSSPFSSQTLTSPLTSPHRIYQSSAGILSPSHAFAMSPRLLRNTSAQRSLPFGFDANNSQSNSHSGLLFGAMLPPLPRAQSDVLPNTDSLNAHLGMDKSNSAPTESSKRVTANNGLPVMLSPLRTLHRDTVFASPLPKSSLARTTSLAARRYSPGVLGFACYSPAAAQSPAAVNITNRSVGPVNAAPQTTRDLFCQPAGVDNAPQPAESPSFCTPQSVSTVQVSSRDSLVQRCSDTFTTPSDTPGPEAPMVFQAVEHSTTDNKIGSAAKVRLESELAQAM